MSDGKEFSQSAMKRGCEHADQIFQRLNGRDLRVWEVGRVVVVPRLTSLADAFVELESCSGEQTRFWARMTLLMHFVCNTSDMTKRAAHLNSGGG